MTLNEERNRMRELAGIKPVQIQTPETTISEGMLANVAAGLGMTLASLTSVMSQTGNIDKLKYNKDTKETLEKAMEDPQVQTKLKELGIEDNNIDKEIKLLKGRKVTAYHTVKTSSEKDLKNYMKMGYHLTSVDRDIIISQLKNKAPETIVETIHLKMNEEALFVSGKFKVSQTDIQNIKSVLDSINESNSVLLKVTIISSTDKQGLGLTLQNTLKNLNFSPDNKGLSEARNTGLQTVIRSLGVDSSIVNKIALSEQGEGIINPKSRYVMVIFDVTHKEEKNTQQDSLKDVTTVNFTYNLLKPKVKAHKDKDFTLKLFKVKINIYDPNKPPAGCPKF